MKTDKVGIIGSGLQGHDAMLRALASHCAKEGIEVVVVDSLPIPVKPYPLEIPKLQSIPESGRESRRKRRMKERKNKKGR